MTRYRLAPAAVNSWFRVSPPGCCRVAIIVERRFGHVENVNPWRGTTWAPTCGGI